MHWTLGLALVFIAYRGSPVLLNQGQPLSHPFGKHGRTNSTQPDRRTEQVPHGCTFSSQLRDHCPHRPWQVDAQRPSAGADGLGDRPRDAGPDSRRHGSGAGAGHHHQGARGAHDVQGEGRQYLSTKSDRHAGTCRFQLRSLAVSVLVRGRTAGGGRKPGCRGTDAGQRLSGHQSRPGDYSGHQQNRPAFGGHYPHAGSHRAGCRPGRDRCDSRQREDRAGRG